jgi:hypothetical protein
MKMPVTALAIACLSAFASPLDAQGLTGRWIAEFDRMVRNENGNVSTGDKAKVRLVLEQRGDSVAGTLEPVDAPAGPGGPAPAPRQLRGTTSGNKVSLSSEAEVRVNMNGEESVRRVTMMYDLTLDGEKLEGTIVTRGPGGEMPARPLSARREKP